MDNCSFKERSTRSSSLLMRLRPALYFLVLFFLISSAPEVLLGDDTNNMSLPSKKWVKTIIVDNYYPYTFVNEKGQPDGFSVDLMKAITKVMGLELEIRVDVWEKARNGLASGSIDFLPMMAYSESTS